MIGGELDPECLEVALRFPGEDWDWRALTRAVRDLETVRAHVDLPWDWARLSHGRYAQLFFEFPGKPWDWDRLCVELSCKYCNHDGFTTEFVIEHIDKPWRWTQMSRYCTRIDVFRILERFPDTPVDWVGLSTNECVTAAILLQHADKPWSFGELSYNRALTLDMLRAFPRADWFWPAVSRRASITLDQILANRDLSWDWAKVSEREDLTYEFAATHPEIEWQWSAFATKRGGVASFLEHLRRTRAARRIQARWRRCVSDPSYLVCQRRLRREFDDHVTKDF